MAKPLWSLITVTFNSAQALQSFWGPLRLPAQVEWIVVDNSSTDDTREVAEKLGARVISLDSNVGFATANNRGFEASLGDYVAFVNPDVRIDPVSLDDLARWLDSNPDSLAAPQLLNFDGSLQANGRGMPYLWHNILHRLNPGLADSLGYTIFAQRGEQVEVVWAMGAALVGTREVFMRLSGPWNSRYFVYYEDHEIGIRAGKRDIRTYVLGDILWTHGWERATKNLNPKAWRLELASMGRFYRSHPSLLAPVHRPRHRDQMQAPVDS